MGHVLAARIVRATAAVTLVLGLTLSGASAKSGTSTAAPRAVAVQLANGATFNWLVKKGSKGAVANAVLVSSENNKPLRARFFGKGSYICSPAGFGKKSRCFAR